MQEQPQLKTRKIENRSRFEAQIKFFFEKYIIYNKVAWVSLKQLYSVYDLECENPLKRL